MKRGIVILFVVCGLAVAMVSRDRRAVNTEEVEAKTESSQSLICSRNTPCAWSIYKHISKIVELNFNNSYCRCEPGTECVINEDDTASNAYIHRCRLPSEPNAWKGS